MSGRAQPTRLLFGFELDLPRRCALTMRHVSDPQPYQIARAQLAVDGEVEESERPNAPASRRKGSVLTKNAGEMSSVGRAKSVGERFRPILQRSARLNAIIDGRGAAQKILTSRAANVKSRNGARASEERRWRGKTPKTTRSIPSCNRRVSPLLAQWHG